MVNRIGEHEGSPFCSQFNLFLDFRGFVVRLPCTAMLVLEKVGKALGATPYCKNAHFARLSADLSVFIRQTHGAFDSEAIGKLTAEQLGDSQGALWQL